MPKSNMFGVTPGVTSEEEHASVEGTHAQGATSPAITPPTETDAIVLRSFGRTSNLTAEKVELPPVNADSVLVEVHAFGVNPHETYLRAGEYAKEYLPALPTAMGKWDASGVVVYLGENAKGRECSRGAGALGQDK